MRLLRTRVTRRLAIGRVPGLVPRRVVAAVAVALVVVAGCGILGDQGPSLRPIPEPTCGGARVEIPGALDCAAVARIAIEHLEAEVPTQLDRGIVALTVELQGCPRGEVPPQLDCSSEDFVQLVTVTLGPPLAGGPIEPSLSVGVGPVSGRVLGIVNPLIR